jgi:glycosyltransferase involved in cell wall biosynthesis
MQKLTELFQTSDFFILPTRAEAAGIVFCEASAYGLPSLAYATGGVSDYVRNGVNGVCVEPGSPPATFAGEIRKLLTDSAAYESCAIQGFREYQERLNWKTSVSKLLGFCADCAQTS